MDEFSVYWKDRDGNQHTEFRFGSIERTKSAMQRLTKGPAAVSGIVTEVMVTDRDDFTNFLWREGKVIFPTKEDLEREEK